MEVKIEDVPISMELDTGAAVSIISEATRKAKFPKLMLYKSKVALKTYTDQPLHVTGQLRTHVKYGNQTQPLVLIVVAENRPSLFGRNLLKYLRLDSTIWHDIAMVKNAPYGIQ